MIKTFKSERGRKISEALKGKPKSLEHRKALSTAHKGQEGYWKGKKRSREDIEKFRISHLGKKDSVATRLLKSSLTKGAKSKLWRGGSNKEVEAIRKSIEYRLWREAVFTRDNWTCIWCKVKGAILNADHIKPFALFPELRLSIDNGRTLCVPCHKKTGTWGFKGKKHGSNIS